MSQLTTADVLKMDLAQIHAAIKAPETSARMQELLRDRPTVSYVSKLMLEKQNSEESRESEVDRQTALLNPPSTEELAAQAAASVAPVEPVVAAAPVVTAPDYTEEDTAWKAEGVVVNRNAAGKIIRMVQEYQVRDDDGSPIGRPTVLDARSPYELLSKQRVAHENATKAFHRVKKQKLSFTKLQESAVMTPAQIKEAAAKALEAKDAAEAEKIVRSIVESDFKSRETKLRQEEEAQVGVSLANQFMRNHLHDFYQTQSNLSQIGEYLKENDLEFTLDNLEFAFQDLNKQGDKLAPFPQGYRATTPAEKANTPSTATVAASTAPVLPAQTTAAAVTPTAVAQQPVATSQQSVEATVTTPVEPNSTAPSTRRPGVNGSIPPGTMSAHRPGAPDPALARKEFMKKLKDMSPDTIRKNLNDPQFVQTLATYGIKVR